MRFGERVHENVMFMKNLDYFKVLSRSKLLPVPNFQ